MKNFETYLVNLTKLQNMRSFIFQIVSFINQLSFVETNDDLRKLDFFDHFDNILFAKHIKCVI